MSYYNIVPRRKVRSRYQQSSREMNMNNDVESSEDDDSDNSKEINELRGRTPSTTDAMRHIMHYGIHKWCKANLKPIENRIFDQISRKNFKFAAFTKIRPSYERPDTREMRGDDLKYVLGNFIEMSKKVLNDFPEAEGITAENYFPRRPEQIMIYFENF